MTDKAPQHTTWFFSRRKDLSILALLIIVGATLRALGVFHGTGHHPDERHMVMVTNDLTENGMNPKSFAYGSFSFYAAWIFGHLMRPLWSLTGGNIESLGIRIPDPLNYDGLFMSGRIFCIFMGLIGIALVYLLSVLVYRKSIVGLVAAALLTFNVFHVQLSRFFTSDVTLTTVGLGAVTALVASWRSRSWGSFLVCGALLGIATATKISSAFLTVPFAAVIIVGFIEEFGVKGGFIRMSACAALTLASMAVVLGLWTLCMPLEIRVWNYAVPRVALLIPAAVPFFVACAFIVKPISGLATRACCAFAVGFLVFCLAQPYGIIDFDTFAKNTREQTSMVQGMWRPPYTIQYEHTMPYFYHLKQWLWYTMGWPLFAAVMIGFAAAAARCTALMTTFLMQDGKQRPQGLQEIVPLIFIVVFFLTTAKFQVKFPRYLLPLYPVMFMFAAALFKDLSPASFAALLPGRKRRPVGTVSA